MRYGLWGGPIRDYMSNGLNSLKGGYIGDYIGVIKGDTRSLDNGSYGTI